MATVADKRKQQQYINKAREMEDKYGIPPYTLVGLLKTESGFNPKAVSKSGAKGIAQFMDPTAKAMNIDPYNTDQSIEGAAKYLSDSHKRLGNWEDSVLSYNMGVAGVKQFKAGKRKLLKEQAEYTQKVFNNRALYYKEPATKNKKEVFQETARDNTRVFTPQYKYDVKDSDKRFTTTPGQYDLSYQPQEITNGVNNFETSQNNTNFASVPDSEKKVDKDIQEVEQQTAEQKFLEEASQMFAGNSEQEQQYNYQEQPQQPMTTDVIGMYNYANNFVAQQGTIYVDSKNDPRYRAYQDSLKAYNFSTNLKKQVEKTKQFPDVATNSKTTFSITGKGESMLPKTKLEKLMSHPDSDPRRAFSKYNEGTGKSMKPVDVLKYPSDKWYSIEAGTLPIYKKPQQKVIVGISPEEALDKKYGKGKYYKEPVTKEITQEEFDKINKNATSPFVNIKGVYSNDAGEYYKISNKKPQQKVIVQQPKVEAVNIQPIEQKPITPNQQIDVRTIAQMPSSFDVSMQRYNMEGPSDYYNTNQENVDYETAMQIKSASDAYNADIERRYGPQNEYRTEKSRQDAAERLKQLRSEFNITPNYNQQGGEEIIDDNMGQYNHPGKVTRISSPYITMKDVPYDILAVADNGEKRIMKPNEEHYFKNAKTVTEYPILTEAEKRFLNEIYNG